MTPTLPNFGRRQPVSTCLLMVDGVMRWRLTWWICPTLGPCPNLWHLVTGRWPGTRHHQATPCSYTKKKGGNRTCRPMAVAFFSHSGWNEGLGGSPPPRSAFFVSLFFLLAFVHSSFAYCFLLALLTLVSWCFCFVSCMMPEIDGERVTVVIPTWSYLIISNDALCRFFSGQAQQHPMLTWYDICDLARSQKSMLYNQNLIILDLNI